MTTTPGLAGRPDEQPTTSEQGPNDDRAEQHEARFDVGGEPPEGLPGEGERGSGSGPDPHVLDGPRNAAEDVSAVPGSEGSPGATAAARQRRTESGAFIAPDGTARTDPGSSAPGGTEGRPVGGSRPEGADSRPAAGGVDARVQAGTFESRTTADTGDQRAAADGQRAGGRRKRGRAEEKMVPDAEFSSYYGHRVVKSAPWEDDIPAYLFFGGLAAGSSLLAAGADLSRRPGLRAVGRITAVSAISVSFLALIHDLGRPERFVNMLRVFKPTSPMSVGTWILSAYAPGAYAAGAYEVARLLPVRFGPISTLLDWAARPGGLAAAVFAPAVASYTAVLLTDTATPAWHDAHRELPFVFAGSAAAAAGGMGMLAAPVREAGPARRLAVAGALVELAVERRMEETMGLSAECLHTGKAGRLMRASKLLTTVGAAGAAVASGRSRLGAVLSGAALLAGSACTRFGVFEAGQQSANDPKYTVVPQRERANARKAARSSATPESPGAAASPAPA